MKRRDAMKQWYPWDPTEVLYIQRLSWPARGMLDYCRECYWQTGQVPDRVLVGVSAEDLPHWEAMMKVWPAVQEILDREASRNEAIRNRNRINANSATGKPLASDLQAVSSHIDIDSNTKVKDDVPAKAVPSVKPRVKKPDKPKEPSKLDDVLILIANELDSPDDKWDFERINKGFWRFLGNWDRSKYPKPRLSALALLEAVKCGYDIQDIALGAIEYKEAQYNKEQFMVMPDQWIKNEGWMPYIKRERVS